MKKTVLIILASVLIQSICVRAFDAYAKAWGEEYYPKVDVDLNKTITNDDSDYPQLYKVDKLIQAYMNEWSLKGVSLSIMKNDSLVYAKGYGWADVERKEKMQPYHLLRMASVSKLITAAGVMNLVDRGMLSLDDKVFGPDGILKGGVYDKVAKDTSYTKITVEHLLRHQGGFHLEPVFNLYKVRTALKISGPVSQEDVIRYAFTRGLDFQPGTSQHYSNLGYLLLSKVVEAVSQMDYEECLQENVFKPIGCHEMRLGGKDLEDRFKHEVKYYSHSEQSAYGGNDLQLCAGAGGWCGSTMELAKFIASIDGKPESRDIVSVLSVQEMTYFSPERPQMYGLGWNDTNPAHGWVRSGTLTGTTAYIKYFPDGECWIFIANTSTWKGPSLSKETAKLFDRCRKESSGLLPKRNLFYYN
ncbi:MAG: beta-lactamase family protein [Bacteroidales bacterium]|nr:beta-lactamase family protein [Bacteroidales bacterium]